MNQEDLTQGSKIKSKVQARTDYQIKEDLRGRKRETKN